MLNNQRILVTGATGQVGRPVAEQLAATNEVWAAARFSDADAKAALEAQGISTVVFTMGDQDLDHLPDVDWVIHCAATTNPKTAAEGIEINAVGTGFLMRRYRDAKGFFHMSSASVYRGGEDPLAVYAEDAELGGRSLYSPHYAMSKLASESVVEYAARELDLPTVIARLEVAYGSHGHGGLPVVVYQLMKYGMSYTRAATYESPTTLIHEDDICTQIQELLGHASVPPVVVNLGGDEYTTIEEIISYVQQLTGLTMTIEEADEPAWETKKLDTTRRRELGGPCAVTWRDGVVRAIEAHAPGATTPS